MSRLSRCGKCSGYLYVEFGTEDTVCMSCGFRKVEGRNLAFNITRNGTNYSCIPDLKLSDKEYKRLARLKV